MIDKVEFKQDIDFLLPQVEAFLMKWYGKCTDYEENCITCKMWTAADFLLCNPFEEQK